MLSSDDLELKALMKSNPNNDLTLKEAKLKIARFCAYQERTQQEVRDKLYSYGLHSEDVESLIADLISENFINEVRFAKTYAAGKFRIKKWGRLKILQGLEQRKLSTFCIKKAMNEIDNQDYQATLQDLLTKRWASQRETDLFIKKHKVAKYLIGRGYEPELVWEQISQLE